MEDAHKVHKVEMDEVMQIVRALACTCKLNSPMNKTACTHSCYSLFQETKLEAKREDVVLFSHTTQPLLLPLLSSTPFSLPHTSHSTNGK